MKKQTLSLLLLIGACTSKPSSSLHKADSMELLVLDPTPEMSIIPKQNFHGFRILDKKDVDPAKLGPALDALVTKGLAENSGYLSACFGPRHGIRTKFGNDSYDFVLSFSCNQIKVYDNGVDQSYLTSNGPEAEMDKLFLENGLTLTSANILPKAGGTVEPASAPTPRATSLPQPSTTQPSTTQPTPR